MPTLNKTVAQLNRLLVACQDGQLGYETLAREACDPNLRQLFASRSLEWNAANQRLRRQIEAYGGRPMYPSLGGEFHRGWEGLKSLLGVIDDPALLDEGLRIETLVRCRFEAVLHRTLAPLVRRQLADQYELLLERQAQLRALLGEWSRTARR